LISIKFDFILLLMVALERFNFSYLNYLDQFSAVRQPYHHS